MALEDDSLFAAVDLHQAGDISAESLREMFGGYTAGSFTCDHLGFTPMRDDPNFLAAIVAQPAEDTPRLVYADYLDEQADARGPVFGEAYRARAELIRLQIAVARGPSCRVCNKSGRFRGDHELWCHLTGIDIASTDIRPNVIVEQECTACDYLSHARRVRWLLDTKYPVAPLMFKVNDTPLKIAGKELWKPVELLAAREVRFVRGFVGLASFRCDTFFTSGAQAVRAAPLESVVISDKVLSRDTRPFGKLGYFWLRQWGGAATGSAVIPEVYYDLMGTLRDLDHAEAVTDCYRWLGWAALWHARKSAGLPDWSPRPADAPTFPPLNEGYPEYVFDVLGVPHRTTPDALATLHVTVGSQLFGRNPAVIEYKGFFAYLEEDGFDVRRNDGGTEPVTVSPIANMMHGPPAPAPDPLPAE